VLASEILQNLPNGCRVTRAKRGGNAGWNATVSADAMPLTTPVGGVAVTENSAVGGINCRANRGGGAPKTLVSLGFSPWHGAC